MAMCSPRPGFRDVPSRLFGCELRAAEARKLGTIGDGLSWHLRFSSQPWSRDLGLAIRRLSLRALVTLPLGGCEKSRARSACNDFFSLCSLAWLPERLPPSEEVTSFWTLLVGRWLAQKEFGLRFEVMQAMVREVVAGTEAGTLARLSGGCGWEPCRAG